MKKKGRFESGKMKRKANKLTVVLSCIAGALALLLLVMIHMIPSLENDAEATQPEAPSTTQTEETRAAETTAPTTEPTIETTVPVKTKPAILPELAEIYAKNPDLAGWVTIEGTVLDYPVMHTPEDGEKYLYKNIKWQL